MSVTILPLVLIGFVALYVVFFTRLFKPKKWLKSDRKMKESEKEILLNNVLFYAKLNEVERTIFENRVLDFLLNHRIIGVECDVSIKDNLLVAASAIIPVFKFPDWQYSNLSEVLLYPTHFNKHHQITGKNRSILGMVGTGHMSERMVLSKQALEHGFKNEFDKKNTAIHEFVHLIDMADGQTDGIPELLMEKQYAIPWINLIGKEVVKINKGKSPIRAYGGTSNVEFFATASEFFFERPKLLARKHPELYDLMETIFNVDSDFKKK